VCILADVRKESCRPKICRIVPGVPRIDDRFHGNARLQRVSRAKAAIRKVPRSWAWAAVAFFPDSDDSSFMTGSEVFVAGGLAQVLIRRVRSWARGSVLEIANVKSAQA